MKYFMLFVCLIFFVSCGTTKKTPPQPSFNFKTQNYESKTDEHNDTVAKDIRQKLLFVNSKKGCTALNGGLGDALKTSEIFCQDLNFFGFNDWRVPTMKEIENFSKGMAEDGLVPFFTFLQCKRTVAIKPDGTLSNINSHNVSPNFEEVELKFPAGIRCVRVDDLP
jgi:hypothetical protein